MTDAEIAQWRVGRDLELSVLGEALGRTSSNVYLWGERGVGKTFLLRLLRRQLEEESATLPVNVSVAAHLGGLEDSGLHGVSLGTVLAVTQTIWKSVVQRPYTDLRATLTEQQSGRTPRRSKRDIESLTRRVYAEVMATERRARVHRQRSFGLTKGATASVDDSRDIEMTLPPIYPFEFVEFVEELLDALESHGIGRLTILLDEANTLALPAQRQLLSEYLDLFASRQVNFAFVAGFRSPELREPRVPTAFGVVQQIEGLGLEASIALIDRVADVLSLNVRSEAATVIAEQVVGKPIALINIMQTLSTRAGGDRCVTAVSAAAASEEYLQRVRESHAWMLAALPRSEGESDSVTGL